MVRYVLTGFGEFHDVPVNPSQIIVKTVTSTPTVSMEGVSLALNELQCPKPLSPAQTIHFSPDTTQVPVTPPSSSPSPLSHTLEEPEIWIHVGVNSQQNGFRLEKIAWNEANFRVPDQRGAQPQNQKIYASPDALPSLQSTLQLDALASSLSELGFPTETSEDPGRFLCNYIYYHTLDYCAKNRTHGLFVHVPPFSIQPLDTQLSFIRSLLDILPRFYPLSAIPPSSTSSSSS